MCTCVRVCLYLLSVCECACVHACMCVCSCEENCDQMLINVKSNGLFYEVQFIASLYGWDYVHVHFRHSF